LSWSLMSYLVIDSALCHRPLSAVVCHCFRIPGLVLLSTRKGVSAAESEWHGDRYVAVGRSRLSAYRTLCAPGESRHSVRVHHLRADRWEWADLHCTAPARRRHRPSPRTGGRRVPGRRRPSPERVRRCPSPELGRRGAGGDRKTKRASPKSMARAKLLIIAARLR
jgi:hypothetical protein